MWEISLALAAAMAGQPQAATLEGCEFVDQRWICRYRLPEVQLLTSEPLAPASVPVSVPVTPTGTSEATSGENTGATAVSSTSSGTSTTNAEIATLSRDPGVLTESETSLVARCAEARWMSLCLPSQRVEARRLRDLANAYEAARLRVGHLLSEGDCGGARAHALSGGYFRMARETQDLCSTVDTAD